MKEKKIQIPVSLFIKLCQYFCLDMDVDTEDIKKELDKKMDAVYRRNLYTTYKTASSDEEKEDARQKYLDEKGVPQSFRW